MRKMHLSVVQEVYSGGRRRVASVVPDDRSPVVEIFHESSHLPALTDSTPLDGHVLSLLLYAMRSASTLIVEGPLTLGMMRNLEELQRVWYRWKPKLYRPIEIRAEAVMEDREVRPPRAISAFSGGLDAMFTALGHAKVLPPWASYPLSTLLMVHGFDVGLERPDDFMRLVERVTPFANELGLQLWTLRTNSQALKLQDWHDSHMLQLVGAMQMFADEFNYALVGSTESYDALVLPWGSSPITDHLMSSDRMAVVHDGAGYSRSEKAMRIADNPTACRTLKVCWAGRDQSENCSRCEKCLRTKLNFLAAGRPIPPCFSTGVTLEDIRSVNLVTEIQRSEMLSCLDAATENSITDPWVAALRKRLRGPAVVSGIGFVPRRVYPALEKAGLKEPLKRARAWYRGAWNQGDKNRGGRPG